MFVKLVFEPWRDLCFTFILSLFPSITHIGPIIFSYVLEFLTLFRFVLSPLNSDIQETLPTTIIFLMCTMNKNLALYFLSNGVPQELSQCFIKNTKEDFKHRKHVQDQNYLVMMIVA